MFLAAFLFFLILLAVFFIVLLAVYPVKVAGVFNSEQQPDMHITMSWLDRFLRGYITNHNGHTIITINLFDKRVYEKDMTTEKNAGFRLMGRHYMDYINMARSIKVNNAKLYASYGFADPAVTGVVCGAVGLLSQYINADELYNNADFMADRSYFNISAEAEINAAVSLSRIIGRNRQYRRAHALGNR